MLLWSLRSLLPISQVHLVLYFIFPFFSPHVAVLTAWVVLQTSGVADVEPVVSNLGVLLHDGPLPVLVIICNFHCSCVHVYFYFRCNLPFRQCATSCVLCFLARCLAFICCTRLAVSLRDVVNPCLLFQRLEELLHLHLKNKIGINQQINLWVLAYYD